ncbi:hypothetical protein MRX96_047593 [Rhipicephalus microplus]
MHFLIAPLRSQSAQVDTTWITDCLLVRIKGIYFLNTAAVFEVVYAIAKPLLSTKLKGRLHFIGHDLSQLCGVIPSELILEEFGGTRSASENAKQDTLYKKKHGQIDMIRQCAYQS